MQTQFKNTRGLFISFALIGFLFLYSCSIGGQGTISPPSSYISLNTFYKTASGTDLLKQEEPLAFKKDDIVITTKIDEDGIEKNVSYNEDGIVIYWDGTTKFYYFEINVPTQYKNKKPIETYVQLSPTIKDTITCTYNLSGTEEERAYPDKVYYNKKLVWEMAKQPTEGRFLPIVIVK